MNAWLTVAAFLFGQGVKWRNQLYRTGWLNSTGVNRPVVSIGNLTVGGTGKTPFSIWLLGRMIERGIQPAFVSRGYRSLGHGARAVTTTNPAEFGDEPVLVHEAFPQIPVYVGADRVAAIDLLLKETNPQIVVADDAFQHRRLKRDLDLVVLDAMEPEWHYDFLPKGRAREDFSALSRAQFLVISKFNLADEHQLAFIKKRAGEFSGPVLEMRYRCGSVIRGNETRPRLDGSIFLISGVGRPESVRKLLPNEKVQHKIFPDHHGYTEKDVRLILDEFGRSKCDHIVVTAKDAVKLRRFDALKDIIWHMNLSVDVQGDVNELDRQIDRLVRPGV